MERDLQAAADAVAGAAGWRGWGIGELATKADVDPGTIGDFLGARRWPQLKTRSAIEKALGWPAGTIARVAAGARPPLEPIVPPTETVGPASQDAEPELPVGAGVDPELLTELAQADPAAIEAVRAVLKAARRGD